MSETHDDEEDENSELALRPFTPPLRAIESGLKACFERQCLDNDAWAEEVLMVSRMAAVRGKEEVALQGYQIVGAFMGAISLDNKGNQTAQQQHTHLHITKEEVSQLSDEELTQQIAQAKEVQATVISDDDDSISDLY